MKVVILAEGYGTRISEGSIFNPKPMIKIGEHPMFHHINSKHGYIEITNERSLKGINLPSSVSLKTEVIVRICEIIKNLQ
jgi:hypothetical protein